MRFGQSDRKIVPVMTIKSAQYDVMQEYIDILYHNNDASLN